MSKKGTLPYDLVTTPSIVRSKCQSLATIHMGDTPLYDGKRKGRSTVYPACLPSDIYNCPYVVKVKELHQSSDIQRFVTEQFFAQYVYEECTPERRKRAGIQASNITPKIQDVWICPTDPTMLRVVSTPAERHSTLTGYMVMDRKEGTLRQFVERYAKTITADDLTHILLQMEAIAYYLSDLHVLHRNVTVDNIVYQRHQQSAIDAHARPGGIDLFFIDWDDVVWNPLTPSVDIKASYKSICEQIIKTILQLQHQTDRQLSIFEPRPTASSSFDFKSFAPITNIPSLQASSVISTRKFTFQPFQSSSTEQDDEEFLPPVVTERPSDNEIFDQDDLQ